MYIHIPQGSGMLTRHPESANFSPAALSAHAGRKGMEFTANLPLPLDMYSAQTTTPIGDDVRMSLRKMAYVFEAGVAEATLRHADAFDATVFDRTHSPVSAHITHTMDKTGTTTERYTGITVCYTPMVTGRITVGNGSGGLHVLHNAEAGLAVTSIYIREITKAPTVIAVVHTYLKDNDTDAIQFSINGSAHKQIASLGDEMQQFNAHAVAQLAVRAMSNLTMPIVAPMVESTGVLPDHIAHLTDPAGALYHAN